jgi:UrcA family protein
LTGLALLCVTTLATATTAPDLVDESKEVKFVASDLQTLAGIAKLYGRIESAAKRVCHEPPRGEWGRYPAFRHCVEVAIEDAVEHVHSPALAALQQSKAHSAAR